jgi:hypothetical protein
MAIAKIVLLVLYLKLAFKYEIKAAALKSYAGRPSASSGASLDFALISYIRLLGYI